MVKDGPNPTCLVDALPTKLVSKLSLSLGNFPFLCICFSVCYTTFPLSKIINIPMEDILAAGPQMI